jgi:hypothetical protein
VAALKAAFLAGSASAALAASDAALDCGDTGPGAEPSGFGSEPRTPAAAAMGGAGGGPVTLETFRGLLAKLSKQNSEMDALPPHCDVGGVRVNTGRLRAALLPWPERRAAEMRAMLPSLAGGGRLLRLPLRGLEGFVDVPLGPWRPAALATWGRRTAIDGLPAPRPCPSQELLHALLDRVHGACSRLGAACGGAEDYAAKLAFLGRAAAQASRLARAAAAPGGSMPCRTFVAAWACRRGALFSPQPWEPRVPPRRACRPRPWTLVWTRCAPSTRCWTRPGWRRRPRTGAHTRLGVGGRQRAQFVALCDVGPATVNIPLADLMGYCLVWPAVCRATRLPSCVWPSRVPKPPHARAASPRAAFASLDAAHASLKALSEEVEGGREAAIAHYSSELDAGEGRAWVQPACCVGLLRAFCCLRN